MNLVGFLSNRGTISFDPLGLSAYDNYIQMSNALSRAIQECRCLPEVVFRLTEIKDKLFAGNKEVNRILDKIGKNADFLKASTDLYFGGIENIIKVREMVFEEIFEFQTPEDSWSSSEFDGFLENSGIQKGRKFLGNINEILKYSGLLTRGDSFEIAVNIFAMLPGKYLPLGPEYFVEGYKGAKKGLENLAPDIFLLRIDGLINQCIMNNLDGAIGKLKVLERRVFRRFLK